MKSKGFCFNNANIHRGIAFFLLALIALWLFYASSARAEDPAKIEVVGIRNQIVLDPRTDVCFEWNYRGNMIFLHLEIAKCPANPQEKEALEYFSPAYFKLPAAEGRKKCLAFHPGHINHDNPEKVGAVIIPCSTKVEQFVFDIIPQVQK